MFIDGYNLFDPAATAVTVTADSTNVLDMGVGRDMGIGQKLSAVIALQQTFTAAGAATLQAQILGAPDNGSGAPGTWSVYAQTDAIPKANLVAGAKIALPLPAAPPQAGEMPPPRFYKLHYVVGTGPFTAGEVESWLTPDPIDQNISYPSGFSISA